MRDESYMRRCFEIAKKGRRFVHKNPMVGAVLVYKNRIIGEGYHAAYGQAHAEVNCIQSVSVEDTHKIAASTLYVSLEPCCHQGKTGPCTDLIIKHHIPNVQVSVLDINETVRGNGIKKLRDHGIHVEVGLLQKEGTELLNRFHINHLQNRPFIQLKWAQSAFGVAGSKEQSVWFSNPQTRFFAHQLRADNEAILIGATTVLVDNPKLNNRLVDGINPRIIIFDPSNKIPLSHPLLKQPSTLIIKDQKFKTTISNQILFMKTDNLQLDLLYKKLYTEHSIATVLVEGGPTLHQLHTKQKMWDEAFVIQTKHPMDSGIKAPTIIGSLQNSWKVGDNKIIQIKCG